MVSDERHQTDTLSKLFVTAKTLPHSCPPLVPGSKYFGGLSGNEMLFLSKMAKY